MTPLQREFDHVWNGFDRSQVREYLANVEATVQHLIHDRDEAQAQVNSLTEQLDAARAQNGELQSRVEELRYPPQNLDDLDERMQRVGHLANLQAEEVTTRAQTAAEERWHEAAQASIALRERYRSLLNELDKQAESLHAQHRAALEETRVETQKLTVDAVRRREQLDAEEERKRRAIEQEFDESMAAQRNSLEKYIADQQTASKNQAQRRLDEASADAKERIEQAQHEADRRIARANEILDALTEISREAGDKLRLADEALAESESLMQPFEEESHPVPRAEDADTAGDTAGSTEGSPDADNAGDALRQGATNDSTDAASGSAEQASEPYEDETLPKRRPQEHTPGARATANSGHRDRNGRTSSVD